MTNAFGTLSLDEVLALPLAEKRRLLPLIERKAELVREREAAEARRLGDSSAAQIRARCRTLAGFMREAWPILEPETPLGWNWHMDAICDHLEATTVAGGTINRLAINVPPGSSKSLTVSVMFQAWLWGPRGRPGVRFLTTAFNDGPVKRDTRKTRDLVASDWYKALWPSVVLTRNGETSFANSETGTREGVAFGSLTSQRGDVLVIDDPHSTETAESDLERARTTRKFREGATNRLNDQERSCIIVIMQRLHEDDVSGTILKLGMGYTHLCLPMEYEPERHCSTQLGPGRWFDDPRQNDGDLLDPARFPRKVVEDLKRDMGAHAYAGQYQQRPAPRGGVVFLRHWFRFEPVAPAGGREVFAWDFAATVPKPGRRPDWTVGLRGKYIGGVFYVLEMVRFQGTPGQVERAVYGAADRNRRCLIRIPQDPGQAGKAQVATYAKLLGGFSMKARPVTGDKGERASPAATQAEAGNVVLVGKPEEWETFMHEVCTFPSGTHDDIVDAFADLINELALGARYSLDNL